MQNEELMEYSISYLLASVGLTVLVVWPWKGPSAFLRERLLRRILPAEASAVLDCYVCFGFWGGLALSPVWWTFDHRPWIWLGCLMIPGLFWLVLHYPGSQAE